jgi:hypothetical protein
MLISLVDPDLGCSFALKSSGVLVNAYSGMNFNPSNLAVYSEPFWSLNCQRRWEMYRDIPCAQPDPSRTHKYQNEYEARSLLSRSEPDIIGLQHNARI